MRFPRLFEPGLIGSLEIRNRIVLPSMTTRLADPEGMVTPDLITYYRERARGGCGLVTVEMASPQARGRHRRNELGISSDSHVAGLRALTAAVSQHGAQVGIQLGHGGARALPAQLGGRPLAATPGPVHVFEGSAHTNYPEVFDEEALEHLIVDHVRAAHRAEEAGFDLIELHGAHGYLLTQLSHQDENVVLPDALSRYRYLAELARRVVQAVDIPVTYRINGQDYYPEGHAIGDTVELLSHVATTGISAVSVSGGHYLSNDPEIMIPPMPYPDGTFLREAALVRQAVPVPVIVAGRLNTADVAERALALGQADFVAIGRGQIADPHWARKTQQGQRVRECLACNHCVRQMRSGSRLACAVNPDVITADRPTAPNSVQRRLVVGGGPAGLTYALESTRAGHTVRVLARRREWLAASAPTFNGYVPDRPRMARYFNGLWQECLDLGVEISLEEQQDGTHVEWADVVVDARGATYVPWAAAPTRLAERLLPLIPGSAARAISRSLHTAFLYRLRRPRPHVELGTARQERIRIGDAAEPGELAAAVHSAYVQAWKGTHHAA
ncbi:NADH:flavin oxidoreductase [Ornithinimicrobium faecis]|uniref:NADH:flavin oxidoreductase n=1 Tax=Ornithinimicrobium faecis TaxID=2934158 RepID=UPI002118D7AF|nr:tRNA-dihydrouridine synthase [Ornithinimicrobium sp. HY1745]